MKPVPLLLTLILCLGVPGVLRAADTDDTVLEPKTDPLTLQETGTQALEEIIAGISDKDAVFAAPVVPVSRVNRTYAGTFLYMGLFKPRPGGRWWGNIKKYGLGDNGEILDMDGAEATDEEGRILSTARSYWARSNIDDGPTVAAGGTGEVLQNQASRNLYTYRGLEADLTHVQNEFSADNLSIDDLNVLTETEKRELINEIVSGDGSWIQGDIVHSRPVVVHYDTDGDRQLDSAYILVGSNDGMLHCFNAGDGSELWGFIPPDQLDRLQLLLNDDHEYFVDGSLGVYDGDRRKILIFGEGRGGDRFYALDITRPGAPKWLYKIDPDILASRDGAEATLGQSWSSPEIHTIKTGRRAEETVFLLAGGYDPNQDADMPVASDAVGRAVFSINVNDGTVSSLCFNAGNYSDMTHCIVDLSGVDSDGDGYMNRVYAGDLGGNVFAFEDDNGDGTWSKRRLFSASAGDGIQRKIFDAPDVVEESLGEMIFFGTGDRAHPEETGRGNRFYAVKNNWVDKGLTESDLVDVTGDLIQLGTVEEKASIAAALEDSKGWYLILENSGEKVTSTPTVFGSVVYFTTYTPGDEAVPLPGDHRDAPRARGTARLYAVDYLTGASVLDWSHVEETHAETGKAAGLGKQDRSKIIGESIPSAPGIAVLESGPKIYISVEGGVVKEDTKATTDMNIFYWRHIF